MMKKPLKPPTNMLLTTNQSQLCGNTSASTMGKTSVAVAVVACDGNTSNLFSHLRTKHPAKYEVAVKAKKQQQQQERKRKRSRNGTSASSIGIKESFSRMGKHDRNSK